jgi:predicted RNA-binding protein with PUA-like domain
MSGGRWVFLADPGDYGWNDLARDGRAVWDGISNSRALNNLRRCAEGDQALIYHTAPDKSIVGIARVTRAAYPDPSNADRVVVDVEPFQPLARPLPLSELKADDVMSQMSFVRMPRVAVWPVTEEQWQRVLSASGTAAAR